MNLLLFFMRHFIRLVLYVYFEKVVVRGQPPAPGPAIMGTVQRPSPLNCRSRSAAAANHPNMLLDPLLVALNAQRTDFSFWAKSVLFAGVQGVVLRALGAVPVQRAKDMPEGQVAEPARFFCLCSRCLQSGHPDNTRATPGRLRV